MYVRREWRVLTSCDMKNWNDMATPLNVKTINRAKAEACAAAGTKRNGTYYITAPVEKDASPPGPASGARWPRSDDLPAELPC